MHYSVFRCLFTPFVALSPPPPYDRVYYTCSSLFTFHIVTLFSVGRARLDIEYLNVDWMIYDNDNGATEQK